MICEVKHEDEAHGVPEEGGGQAPEPLLARRVPQLQLDPLAASLEMNGKLVLCLQKVAKKFLPIFPKSHSSDLSK